MPLKPAQSAQGGQQVDLGQLTAQQLMQVKKQLDDELEHLNSSFNQLRNAQARFDECSKSIQSGISDAKDGSEILVPLTTSLYVPGTLASRETVIVDVGTGFYVEKTAAAAITFYTDKTKELGSNLKDLESILQGKSNNLRVVEDGSSTALLSGRPKLLTDYLKQC